MKRNILILALLSLFGCSDFLEPKSKSEFVPKDANSLNELLLGEAYPRRDFKGFFEFLALLDDDVDGAPYQKPITGQNLNKYVAAFTWQPDMYDKMKEAGLSSCDIYFPYYNAILGTNAVLDYIDDIQDDDKEMENYVRAQAHALRGFYYFTLVNIFGHPYNSDPEALGVPLKLNSGVEEQDLKRASVGKVYEQILADLGEAERLYQALPESYQWKANYRTNLPMVQLLLSRVHLYMENWQEAARYADAIMQNSNFRLLDLNTIDTVDKYQNPQYMDYHSFENSHETIWIYGNVWDFVTWVYDLGDDNRPFFKASDGLMKSFDELPGDLRRARYVVRSHFSCTNHRGEFELMPQAFGKIATGTDIYYYRPFHGTGTFGRSLRLSEAYLNYCEAKAMMYKEGTAGALTDALQALNKLRKYRFAEDQYREQNISNADELIAFIRAERRRELCFEGHRWFDLRRWGMPAITHTWNSEESVSLTYTLQENDPSYTVPLPPEALDANGSLVQNPLGEAPRGAN